MLSPNNTTREDKPSVFKQPVTSLLHLGMLLTNTLDLVNPKVVTHHRRVAYIAYLIGIELNLPLQARKELLLAGALHDIGAFSVKERLEALDFDLSQPHKHSEIGYQILKEFLPLSSIAKIIRFHHTKWNYGEGNTVYDEQVPLGSHIIHIADRISVLIPEQRQVIGHSKAIVQDIKQHSGTWFRPDLVEAFSSLAEKEYFWLDAASANPTETLRPIISMSPVELDMEAFLSLSKVFSHIIDFRSLFTATHSAGVAASAESLATLAGFSEKESQLMRIAGYFHDLGKLAIPAEILEKPGNLTPQEWDTMRTHTYHGFRTLQTIPVLETINIWGSLHHERMDGSGYPFHLTAKDLPLGSRIMAVADVFAALTENRPYRPGMRPEKAVDIITDMALQGALDSNVVDLLKSNLHQVNIHRQEMASESLSYYQNLFDVFDSY